MVKRKTSSSRMERGLQAITQWCRWNLHRPLREQQHALSQKLRGHCAYYGITGNSSSLSAFRWRVHRIWRYWLSRREPRTHDDLGLLQPDVGGLPSAPGDSDPLSMSHVAKPCSEEPYALMRARTDLWEPGAGNRPGSPGHH